MEGTFRVSVLPSEMPSSDHRVSVNELKLEVIKNLSTLYFDEWTSRAGWSNVDDFEANFNARGTVARGLGDVESSLLCEMLSCSLECLGFLSTRISEATRSASATHVSALSSQRSTSLSSTAADAASSIDEGLSIKRAVEFICSSLAADKKTAIQCLKSCAVIAQRIIDNPNEKKYTRLLRSNATLVKEIFCVDGTDRLLFLVGFEEVETRGELSLVLRKPNYDKLRLTISIIQFNLDALAAQIEEERSMKLAVEFICCTGDKKAAIKCLKSCAVIARRIIDNPSEPKYARLMRSNATLIREIFCVNGTERLLLLVGFEEVETRGELSFVFRKPNHDKLILMISVIQFSLDALAAESNTDVHKVPVEQDTSPAIPREWSMKVKFGNTKTGEQDARYIRSSDPASISSDPIVHDRWCKQVGERLAHDKGWASEDILIVAEVVADDIDVNTSSEVPERTFELEVELVNTRTGEQVTGVVKTSDVDAVAATCATRERWRLQFARSKAREFGWDAEDTVAIVDESTACEIDGRSSGTETALVGTPPTESVESDECYDRSNDVAPNRDDDHDSTVKKVNEAIESIKEAAGDGTLVFKRCLANLSKVMKNVQQYPKELKYRRLRRSKQALIEVFLRFEGSLSLLELAGFVNQEHQGDAHFILEEGEDIDRLNLIANLLDAAIEFSPTTPKIECGHITKVDTRPNILLHQPETGFCDRVVSWLHQFELSPERNQRLINLICVNYGITDAIEILELEQRCFEAVLEILPVGKVSKFKKELEITLFNCECNKFTQLLAETRSRHAEHKLFVGFIHASPLLLKSIRNSFDSMHLRQIMKSKDLEFRFNALIGNIESLQFLLMKGCHFLHLSVIGLDNGNLAFEDEYGGVNSITPASLKEITKVYRPPCIAFVAAAHGHKSGLALVEAGVAHVIAATGDAKTLEDEGPQFSRIFYDHIFRGFTVRESFDAAELSIRLSRQGSRSHFVLLPETTVDGSDVHALVPRVVTCVKRGELKKGDILDESPLPTVNECFVSQASFFVGREQQLVDTVRLLTRDCRRFVTLTGAPGCGKSATAHRLASHLAERHVFSRVVHFDLYEESEMMKALRVKFGFASETDIIQRGLAFVADRALKAKASFSESHHDVNLWDRDTVPSLTEITGYFEQVLALSAASGGDHFSMTRNHILLVIDNADQFCSALNDLLNSLFSCFSNFSVLCTCRFGVSETVESLSQSSVVEQCVQLDPLGERVSSELLLQLRSISSQVVGVADTCTGEEIASALSQHSVSKALRGNPRAIKSFSLAIGRSAPSRKLSDLVSEAERCFRETILQYSTSSGASFPKSPPLDNPALRQSPSVYDQWIDVWEPEEGECRSLPSSESLYADGAQLFPSDVFSPHETSTSSSSSTFYADGADLFKSCKMSDGFPRERSANWAITCDDISAKPQTTIRLRKVGTETTEKCALDVGAILGEGHYGVTHRAYFRGTEVAVKIFKNGVHKGSDKNLAAEFGILKELHHPNTILFMAACLEGPIKFIVTEYMPGGDLSVFVRRPEFAGPSSSFPTHVSIRILTDVCRGMAYLHGAEIVHGDLTSANILLTGDVIPRAKVSDFGIAYYQDTQDVSSAGGGGGGVGGGGGGDGGRAPCNFLYSAPEVIRAQYNAFVGMPSSPDFAITAAADVFSFAIVVADVFSGGKAVDIELRHDESGVRKVTKKEFMTRLMEPPEPLERGESQLGARARGIRPSIPSLCPPRLAAALPYMWDFYPSRRPGFLKSDSRSECESFSLLPFFEELEASTS